MKFYALLLLVSLNLLAQEEETEALKFMRLSCEKQKVGLGCFNYANMLIRADKNDHVDKYFELGCKYQHTPSCKKEKWVIPDVVVTKFVPKSNFKKNDESENKEDNSDEEITSAFDIKAPAGYTPSTSAASSSSNQGEASINYNPVASDGPQIEAQPSQQSYKPVEIPQPATSAPLDMAGQGDPLAQGSVTTPPPPTQSPAPMDVSVTP